MELQPLEVGPIGSVSTQTPGRATGVPAPLGAPVKLTPAVLPEVGDSAASLLQELSQPDLGKLLAILDRLPLPESLSQPEVLSQLDQASLESGDRVALSLIAAQQHPSQELALLAPQLPPHATANPPQLDQTPHRVLSVAHMDAENKLGQATRLVDDLHPARLPNWDAKPEVLLHLASTFVDAGTYVNYVRAADLSQIMIDALRFLPVMPPQNTETWSTRFVAGLKRTPWPIALPALLALALLISILLGWWGSH